MLKKLQKIEKLGHEKNVEVIDIIKSFPTSNRYDYIIDIAKTGVESSENEPSEFEAWTERFQSPDFRSQPEKHLHCVPFWPGKRACAHQVPGQRHRKGLPLRGQRTRTNARTRRGSKKTVAGKKK